MTVVVTCNEPQEIRELFKDRLEIPMGFDFLIYTKRCPLPMERKKIPGDLIASIQDGRLQRELIAMRAVNPKFYLIILHGSFDFRRNGDLVMPDNHMRQWTKKGIRNLCRTLQLMEGAIIERAETDKDLVEVIDEWQTYLDTDVHRSIRNRPRLELDWSRPEYQERVKYFFQGLPGIKEGKSAQMCKVFKTPLDLYAASVEDLMKVEGFGRGTAVKIHNFLRGIENGK